VPSRNDPNWNKPKRTDNPANDLIRALRTQLAAVEQQKKPQESVQVLYAGAFGILLAARILPEGADLLRMEVGKKGGSDWIVAPVSECSFMFSVVRPSAGKPKPRIILGFADHD
jgi:hypothetical protein